MNRLLISVRLSFQARVLIPVVTIMVLLVIVPMAMVSRRMSSQLEAGASEKLATADAVFKNLQSIRANNLLLRYRNVPNEPRFKAVAQKSDPETLRFLLDELIDELGGDIVLFASAEASRVTRASRNPEVNLDQFASRSASSIKRALGGESNVETLSVSGKLYDVVSISATVADNIVGAVTVGTELGNGVAEEFKQLTGGEIVLLADGRMAVSTLASPDLATELQNPLNDLLLMQGPGVPQRPRSRRAATVVVNGEHFMYIPGRLGESSDARQLGYLLLSSYERPLQVLQAMQRSFLWIQLAGILLGTILVSILVRKITHPLRQLRDSAEAVGQGDFSQRVEVASRDECGELAAGFNRMTANLKASREQLEKTVETLKATQAQLVQSEKLRAIGTLAGGIAHDFNNILGAILGFGELLWGIGPRRSTFRKSDRAEYAPDRQSR
jgi:HAMP domain-containing protein